MRIRGMMLSLDGRQLSGPQRNTHKDKQFWSRMEWIVKGKLKRGERSQMRERRGPKRTWTSSFCLRWREEKTTMIREQRGMERPTDLASGNHRTPRSSAADLFLSPPTRDPRGEPPVHAASSCLARPSTFHSPRRKPPRLFLLSSDCLSVNDALSLPRPSLSLSL